MKDIEDMYCDDCQGIAHPLCQTGLCECNWNLTQ